MKRTFCAIGQGVFNIESFSEDSMVIIDCGSEDKFLLESRIAEKIKEKSDIDYVFLSHFHNDHINGIEYLVNSMRVKNIVIPYMDPISRFLLSIENILSPGRDFYKQCIEDFTGTIHKIDRNINIYSVVPENKSTPNTHNQIISQQSINLGCTKWQYIPYYYHDSAKRRTFFSYLKANGISNHNKLKDAKFINNNRETIIEAYKRCENNLNDTSLMVYSGPAVEDKTNNDKKYDCLYTGDISLKRRNSKKEIKSFIDKYGTIGVIELPHHGSSYNFSNYILDKSDVFVASAGAKNKYNHPHKKVMEGVNCHKKEFLLITEDRGSEWYI